MLARALVRPFLVQSSCLRQWRGWQAPALQALAIQTFAALFTWAMATWANQHSSTSFYLGQAALLQGVIAALVTALRRLARWWIAIQLIFPFALLITLSIQLPSWIFLAAFLFMLTLYWSTFRTQVPFYPSGPAVWKSVLALLPLERAVRVVDIGSGLGGLALYLARSRPESSFLGIELAPLPWLISRLRAMLTGNRARFTRGDYEALDLGQFDVVFAYLSPAAMPALWQKAQREMRPGAWLLSYEFPIPDQIPQLTVLPNPHGPTLYGWQC